MMKKKYRNRIMISVLILLLSLSSYAFASAAVKVTKVSLNKTTVKISVGESDTLKATVSPKNATNKKVVWKSSDLSIVKVKNGKITGIKEGSATVTVTTDDGGKAAKCKVTVTDPTVTLKDKALEKEIRAVLKLPSGKITQSKLSSITSLNLSNKNIRDLSGLEYCTGLEELDLSGNEICGVSNLKGMKKLKTLNLNQNLISDVSPLSSLTGLSILWLEGNPADEAAVNSQMKALPDCELHAPTYNYVTGID
jgi:Leucine-rich repeat (LRR) protein